MKVKTLSALAGLGGALIMSSQSQATYLGLGVRTQSASVGVTVGTTTTLRTVYRVYALFNDASDYATAVAGSDIVGNLVIQNYNAANTALGSGFFNAGPSNTSPITSSGSYLPPNGKFDTFCTIGQAIHGNAAPDSTSVTLDGWPGFVSGNSLSNNNMAWFTQGPVEAGRAGGANGLTQAVWFNGGAAVAGANNAFGILLMQLTVAVGENVRGSISVSGTSGALAAAFTSNGQTFNSGIVPGQGALALLGLAGLVGSRRRRA